MSEITTALNEILLKCKDGKNTECSSDSAIHFIGILGSGCYPLARLLSARGYRVTGSDAALTDTYTDESSIGLVLSGPPHGTAMAVYSLAISESDPEILSARSRGIPLVSRAQLLGALMSLYPVRISVSGSHGKSTTTAIAEHILSLSGLPHTAVSGALLATGSAYTDDGGDIFLAEACEYKDSFLCLRPTHQIITSVELDHTDYFDSLDAIRASFLTAAGQADTVIINCDDTVAAGIARELTVGVSNLQDVEKIDTSPTLSRENADKTRQRVITYGYSPDADYRIHSVCMSGGCTSFSLSHGTHTLTLSTPLIGRFNLYNLAAAAALADTLGIDSETVARAISDFHGIDRRLSLVARVGTVPIYYDYAHHPTEIAAVITALKERHGSLTVIFRPHTYSRTESLWREFVAALSLADRVILLDVYPAREEPIEGINSYRLAQAVGGAIYSSEPTKAARLAIGQGTDAIALLGAGDVADVKRDLEYLAKQNGN